MHTPETLMPDNSSGELSEISQRALAYYRDIIEAGLSPEQEGRGLAIHVDSGEYLIADTPTQAGHAMRLRHPEGGTVTLRIGMKPDYLLTSRSLPVQPKAG